MPKCLHCQRNYIAGALYCDYCGHRLPQPTSAPAPQVRVSAELPDPPPRPKREAPQRPEDPPEEPPHLRLQIVQSGILFDLDSREKILIGRKDPDQEPDVDLAPYGGIEQGVGRRHALITLKQGRYYIEDLKSINETLLNSSRLFPGQLYPLADGDVLRFGAMLVRVLL